MESKKKKTEGKRRQGRRRALQLLYALELNPQPYAQGEDDFLQVDAKRRKGWGDFPHALASKTYADRDRLDAEIAKTLHNWRLERLPITDRICLRMALCELAEFADIPLRATLDEYIELARLFGTEDSPRFVNGVLNALAADFRHKDNRAKVDADPPDVSAAIEEIPSEAAKQESPSPST